MNCKTHIYVTILLTTLMPMQKACFQVSDLLSNAQVFLSLFDCFFFVFCTQSIYNNSYYCSVKSFFPSCSVEKESCDTLISQIGNNAPTQCPGELIKLKI